MSRPFFFTTITFILARFTHGVYKPCPDRWNYFSVDNTCLSIHYIALSFEKSRAWCNRTEKEGDLATFKDGEKKRFLTGLKPSKTLKSWIGVHDLHNDGKYYYLDSTELGPAQGLGKWQSPLETLHYKCVYYDNTGWRTAECDEKHYPACEIKLVKWEDKTLESCKKSNWEFQGDIYFRLFPYPRIYDEAYNICKLLDAELAKVHNAGTQKFIKGLDHFGEKPAWIGLRRFWPNWIWKWMDGTTLESFKAWERRPLWYQHCATAGNPKPSWIPRRCVEKRWFICASKEPCPAKPALTINDGEPLKGTVTLTGKQSVTVKCCATNFKAGVTGVNLRCTWGGKKEIKGKDTTSASYKIDTSAHTEKCTCRVTNEDASYKETSFTVNWETTPVLKKAGNKTKAHEMDQGGSFVLEFEVFLNPGLEETVLMKNGKEVEGGDSDRYFSSVDDIKESKYSRVILVLPEVDLPDTGDYVLRIGNGMDKTLDYGFKLKVLKVSSKPSISINEGSPLGETVEIVGEKTIRIKCFPRGLTTNIKEASLTCTWDKENPSVDRRSPTLTIDVDFTYNREMCSCRMTLQDKTYEEFIITIDFQSPPFYENDDYEVKTYNFVEGDDVLVEFMAFINPDMNDTRVTRNGSEVTRQAYDIFLDIIPDSKMYRVTLFFEDAHWYYNGKHSLFLNNSLGSLKYQFVLNFTEVEEPEVFNSTNSLAFLIGSFLLVGVVLSCLLLLWFVRKCKSPYAIQSDKHQILRTSYLKESK